MPHPELSLTLEKISAALSAGDIPQAVDLARGYDVAMRLADVLRGKLPLAMAQIRHEPLIADLPAQLRDICNFAAIPWSDNLATFAQRPHGRAIATPSAQGVNQEGVAQWRKYERHLASILPVLEPWAARFGYPP